MSPSRRNGWLALAAVVAAVLGVGLVRRRRRRETPGAPEPAVRPALLPAVEPTRPARSLVRLAIGAAAVVVLAVVTVIVTRPSSFDPPHAAGVSSGPMPLADCQAAIAEHPNLACGYETAGLDRIYAEPSADPNDPRYAGAALPTGLSTGGRVCVAGSERPIVDTVRPVLSASFTAVPGLRRVHSTFQITGVYGRTADDVELPGDSGDPLTAVLDLRRQGALKHGQSYRWRVRGTPPGVGAAGWSPWCEFTIPEKTPDDLGLDDRRDYRAVLAAAEWREILAVLDPLTTAAPIEAAVKTVKASDARVPVTLNGRAWSGIVNDLASTASQNNDRPTWKLADLVSSALGGPDRPTMGHPRT